MGLFLMIDIIHDVSFIQKLKKNVEILLTYIS